ncbi:MAG: Ig-like domain-containing protein [Acidobacteriaceae bacterium]
MFKIRSVSSAVFVLVAALTTCFAQSPATTSPSQAAYVYVGTSKGVYLYDASTSGALTAVSGSPFSVTGNAVGSNGTYFVTLDPSYVHSYSVASNGAIQGQVSQIDTQTYFSEPNSGCGGTAGAEFDHTGQDIYVLLGLNGCATLQSYEISSAGALSFLDTSSFENGTTSPYTFPPAITADGQYGYSGRYVGFCTEDTEIFQRQSSGAMQYYGPAGYPGAPAMNFPTAQPNYGYQAMPALAADPANHLAVALWPSQPCGPYLPVQLASYTVGSDGSLLTTNTMQNMPTPNVYPTVMNMSPSGQFLAVGGDPAAQGDGSTTPQTPGLQVFNFNGANPITTNSGTLTTAPIDEIHWDKSNHLYALSNSTGKLYVYTVTATGATAASGSPYSIPTPTSLVVVPTATGTSGCAAPTSPGINICAPANDATVGSPVEVEATATVTGTLASTQLWVDGVKKYSTASNMLDTSISVAAGSHRFAVLATNTSGQKWESVVDATVAGTSSCSAPTSPGVNICMPASGSTVNSPVQVQAAALVTGTIASTQLWVDGAKKYSTASTSLNTSISLSAGTHRFAVLALNTAGQKWETAIDATVK